MESLVSHAIVRSYFDKLERNLDVDVAIVGGGPSALVAAAILSEAGMKTAIFERRLAPGGGMWGGAMLFNEIAVQKELTPFLDSMGMKWKAAEGDAVLVDSVHATSALIYRATCAGATVFNGFSVEDVILKESRVSGIVVNWASIHREGLPVDPLMICARFVVDGTGHPCEIVSVLSKKNGVALRTETGSIMGERSLDVVKGERTTLENTGEIYPGLYVCGMAANGVRGSFRMGPIFGGMLMSGKKTAELILEEKRA
jgi:thiamine thiazole synthase